MSTDHPTIPSGDAPDIDSLEPPTGLFPGGGVVQLVAGHFGGADAEVASLESAPSRLTEDCVVAVVADTEWSWLLADIEDVFHGGADPWTILAVPGVADHGVSVRAGDTRRFRRELERILPASTRLHQRSAPVSEAATADVSASPREPFRDLVGEPDGPRPTTAPPVRPAQEAGGPVAANASPWLQAPAGADDERLALPLEFMLEPRSLVPPVELDTAQHQAVTEVRGPHGNVGSNGHVAFPDAADAPRGHVQRGSSVPAPPPEPAGLEARSISAWFGTHRVLDSVSLEMAAGEVTALIGPSGCGKSTFLRILNRMHELIPSASLAGEVLLDGADIYDSGRKVTEARRQIGMVFQKPNPFPAMSIYDNVLASLQLTGKKMSSTAKDEVVESCLRKAGLWNEVRERLRQPGGSLSGGQQQRLCIARALAIRPKVLLMDEPCSALDPTSTRRIEQTISELASEVTIVIVTHNMQQAARVSARCAFFLAEQGTPGVIVEHGPTEAMFHSPRDQRTSDYVNGRFG